MEAMKSGSWRWSTYGGVPGQPNGKLTISFARPNLHLSDQEDHLGILEELLVIVSNKYVLSIILQFIVHNKKSGSSIFDRHLRMAD